MLDMCARSFAKVGWYGWTKDIEFMTITYHQWHTPIPPPASLSALCCGIIVIHSVHVVTKLLGTSICKGPWALDRTTTLHITGSVTSSDLGQCADDSWVNQIIAAILLVLTTIHVG